MGCGHLVKELVLVRKQCVIAPHVFQQFNISSMVYVRNCSMGNLVDEIPFFSNDNILFMVET